VIFQQIVTSYLVPAEYLQREETAARKSENCDSEIPALAE
jgi:hypothetical protein